MFLGKTAGTIGETSMFAIIIGACILLITGVIDLRIPGTYIVTFVLFGAVFGGHGFDHAFLAAQITLQDRLRNEDSMYMVFYSEF